jgi:hypothetical protein
MEATKILIKLFDLPNEKMSEVNECFVELGESYLLFHADYYSTVPKNQDDHSLGWKDRYQKFSIKVRRSNIMSVELEWLEESEMYSVVIEIEGYPVSIRFYFKKESEAKVMRDKLDAFILW